MSEVGRRKRRIVNTRVPRKRCSTVTSAESTLNKKGVTKNVRFFKRIDKNKIIIVFCLNFVSHLKKIIFNMQFNQRY